MKTEPFGVSANQITDVPGLDPIRYYLQSTAPGEGRITVGCYGKAWECYFNAIGNSTLREFLCAVDADYLTGKLSTGREKKDELAYLGRIVRAVQESLRYF